MTEYAPSICNYLGADACHSFQPEHPGARPRDRSKVTEGSAIIDYEDIDMTNCAVVGKGAVGMVVRARWKNQDVAVKMLRDFCSDRSLKGTRAAIARKDFNQEMYIVSQQLRHPNLVQALGICSDDSLSCMIVFEYVHGGSLDDVLFKKNRFGQSFRPGRKLSLQWCRQLASSLDYLHSRKPCIIHRDVKPSNILITHDMKTLKLTDLGLATSCSDDENRKMTGFTGSHCFMAPEVYRDAGFYNERVDVYSAAMVMWCISTGRKPAEGRDESIYTALSSFGLTPDLGAVKPSGLRQILTDAWSLESSQRPSAGELVQRIDALLAKADGKLKRMLKKLSSKLFSSQSKQGEAAGNDSFQRTPSGSSLNSTSDRSSVLMSELDGTITSRRTLASAECTERGGESTNWIEEEEVVAGARV